MKNAESYIKETLQSLLNQTYFNFEIIIINDGSTDNCQSIAESFNDDRIKIFQGKSEGISAALNLALSHAVGRYICRCDADDLYPENRLKTQVDWLELHPEYSAVAGNFSSIDEKSRLISAFDTGYKECDITRELLEGMVRTTLASFLITKELLARVGSFRSYFITAEDIDMQLRLAEKGKIGYIPENMYFYRIHNSSITHVQSSNKRMFYEKAAREFLKQRLECGQDLLQRGVAPTAPQAESKGTDSVDQIIGYMISESWRLHKNKFKADAVMISVRACCKKPFDWKVWKNIIMILVKK